MGFASASATEPAANGSVQDATIIHPRASELWRSDQRRENQLEWTSSARRMAADKFTALRALRQDRDRRLATAVANAVSSMPFAPHERNTSPSGPGSSDETPAPMPGEADSTTRVAAQPLPEFITAQARDATETLRQAAVHANREVFGEKISDTAPPALLVLALVAIFVVPAAGFALILLGLAHLRGHSLAKGSFLVLAGALTIWATYAVARSVNPDFLHPAKPAAYAADRDTKGID
jgi:hypothetical protein